MYFTETHTQVIHEKYQDRLREIERQRLVRLVEGPDVKSKLYQTSVRWLGIQLVAWGTKLQQYAQPSQILTEGVKKRRLKYS